MKMVPFESFDTVSYLHSIVTMALSCISSKIKREIFMIFYTQPAFDSPIRGYPLE